MKTTIKIKGKVSTNMSIPPLSLENLNFFITTQAGVESLVKKEAQKNGLTTTTSFDRIIRASGNEKQMYELLVWSRFSNRIYLEISTGTTRDFDSLFTLVNSVNWRQYIPNGIAIVTEATSIRSELSHTPTIQSITKKAIVSKLTQHTGTHHLYEDRESVEAHIQVFIIENTAYILLDITGEALHKRGYRTESGEAPIKETLAASIVALSGWKFRDIFLDPFCGSGTIAIEAAMLARNIAPGIRRRFAIERFNFFNKTLLETVKQEAKERIYPSGKYTIIASDIDPVMLEKAKHNAIRVGVDEDISFVQEDFFTKNITEATHIVTNPPYGVRLENISDKVFYTSFIEKMNSSTISGGFITSYEFENTVLDKNIWKDRKIYNGGLAARLYIKKPA